MKPRYFATPAAFRAWLEEHGETSTELWVGFHKKGTGRPSITWPEAVDAALAEIADDFVQGFTNETRARQLRPVIEMLVADPRPVIADMVEEALKFKRRDGDGAARIPPPM